VLAWLHGGTTGASLEQLGQEAMVHGK
jgi:hypothetical protein